MWIFTKTGFISAIQHQHDPQVLTVRARSRKHLAALAEHANLQIANSPGGDYPYRLFVDRDVFSDYLVTQVLEIDYSNFKSKVAQSKDFGYLDALHETWVTMHKVEDSQARTNEPIMVPIKPLEPRGGDIDE